MSKKQIENSYWQCNSIQFPRLICELQAAGALKPKLVENICESMDILPEELNHLIERASEKRYENTQRITGNTARSVSASVPDVVPTATENEPGDETRFIETLQSLGGKSGNIKLRKKLNLSEGAYELIKNKLLDRMKIKSGLGRGGSVILV
jgi:hypothetical protein